MKKVVVFILFIILSAGFTFAPCASAAQADNYLSSVKKNWGNKKCFVRFDTKTPIRVYIDKSSVSLQWSDEVRKAFEKWQYALSGLANIVFVSDPKNAHIICRFDDVSNHPERENWYGYAGIRSNFVEVVIGTKLPSVRTSSVHIATYNTALHEAGHALGIWGHSPYEGDVMYESSYLAAHHARQSLSARDKKTIRMLYETEKDVVTQTKSTCLDET